MPQYRRYDEQIQREENRHGDVWYRQEASSFPAGSLARLTVQSSSCIATLWRPHARIHRAVSALCAACYLNVEDAGIVGWKFRFRVAQNSTEMHEDKSTISRTISWAWSTLRKGQLTQTRFRIWRIAFYILVGTRSTVLEITRSSAVAERLRVLRVNDYFAKSLKLTQGHWNWYHSKAWVWSYIFFPQ